MRTHGAKQQREAVKRTPMMQLEPVFEALGTLGNTKWRVNRRVLSVIDRIWSSGGSLAGLVSRDDVGYILFGFFSFYLLLFSASFYISTMHMQTDTKFRYIYICI